MAGGDYRNPFRNPQALKNQELGAEHGDPEFVARTHRLRQPASSLYTAPRRSRLDSLSSGDLHRSLITDPKGHLTLANRSIDPSTRVITIQQKPFQKTRTKGANE